MSNPRIRVTPAEWRRPITLAGGFHCDLTGSEANKWTKFIIEQQEYLDLMTVESEQRRHESMGHDPITLAACVKRVRDAEKTMYDIAEAWYIELRADGDWVSDGMGSAWKKCGPDCDLHVVRPGKAQCSCDDANGGEA